MPMQHLVEAITADELAEEIEEGGDVFSTEYFHQVFGEEERITGYKGLAVHIWLSARTYHAW